MSSLPLLTLLTLQATSAPVDFAREVRPLLSDRCFLCHGPDEAARRFTGGLRLDTEAGAKADLGGYAAVVPGDLDASELVWRIRSEDRQERMPPPDSKLELSPDEVALLERWIAEGADYRAHWAFEPPRRAPLPETRAADWALDPLDVWILAGIEEADLTPAPDAAREAWLRRVTFDLTGLPPTLEELDHFLADETSGMYERVADRLLRSDAHAERMAADWLDLARYADTWGYQNDRERRVWPWRDWVIAAFARNLPYDEFATWQLAGDLLPEATQEQRLATAFNRLHRMTNEGGSVEEEFRVESVADRVHTFGTTFLGLTMECARCHDHKFDPVETEEYYGLFAFFDDVDEAGLYSHFTDATPTPALDLPSAEQASEIARLGAEVARLEAATSGSDEDPALQTASGERGRYLFETIEAGTLTNELAADNPGKAAAELKLVPGKEGLGLQLPGDSPASFPGVGEFTRDDPFTIGLWLKTPDEKERAVIWHRSRAWTDAASQGYQLLIEGGRISAALIHFWPGNAICVRAREPLPVGRWVHVAVTYDGSSRASGLRLFVDGALAATEVVRDALTRSITGGGPPALTIGERFRDRGFTGGVVDELRVFGRELSAREVAVLHDGQLGPGTGEAREDTGGVARLEKLRAARRALSKARDAVPDIVTMHALSTVRDAFVLERGAYDRRGARVEPTTPRAVLPFADELPPDRLGLARWLFDARNPLSARVAANRLWRITFGRGLVETAENFGSQGTPPSHPELLDMLALDLVESGWDQRALLRRFVLSRTYRQSSRTDEGALARDPQNRLSARASSFRLPAEMLRDAALAVSGLLVERVGGPSVKPYQPPGLWQEKSGARYVPDEGEGLHRRSLYTFWKRTSPPPTMMLFDAAKRDVCVARRQTTATPLQALVVWNDPQFVEAARALAARALVEEPQRWIAHAFRLATTRSPDALELELLATLFESERARFTEEPEAARALLAVGAAPVAAQLEPAQLAAGTLVATAILSSDAFLVRR